MTRFKHRSSLMIPTRKARGRFVREVLAAPSGLVPFAQYKKEDFLKVGRRDSLPQQD